MTARTSNKRQKRDHVSSSDDEHDASFASPEDFEVADSGAVDATNEQELDQSDSDSSELQAATDGGVITQSPRIRPRSTSVQTKSRSGSQHTENGKENGRKLEKRIGATAYAAGTFKSNIFKMQVDELLQQIRPKSGKHDAAAASALHALKATIEQLPATKPSSISEAEQELILRKISIPFPKPRPSKDAKHKLVYSKPAKINVVGSFALKTSSRTRDRLEVDMIVIMPDSIFEEKDFMNYRYFHKRAYYLARIADGVKQAHNAEFTLSYQLFHDDPLRPILTVSSAERPGALSTTFPSSKWRINIMPCVDQNQFAAAKLRPDRNCVRQAGHGDPKVDESLPAPTPFYNSSLRSEMLATGYLKLLHAATKRCDAFLDACLLGGTWLRQRGYGSRLSAGGFGNFEWSALVALSLQAGGPGGRPLLSEGYSSYQLFKATLQLLAVKDLRRQPLVIGDDQNAPHNLDDETPMLWDAARAHNVFFKVSPWSYEALRSDARTTLAMLGDQFYNGFDATFILNVKEPWYRFDSLTRLPLTAVAKTGEAITRTAHPSLVQLHAALKRGLSDRVNLITFFIPPAASWAIGSAPPRISQDARLIIGLAVNPGNVNRAVDQGPAAEKKDAAASFRQFWGEKAELRRFKDGSILESVVWAEPDTGDSILKQILRFLIQKQLGTNVSLSLLDHNEGFASLIPGSTDMSVFQPLMTYLNKFENDLRDLREMPLSIRQIMPADPQLRYSSIQAPPHGKTNRKPMPSNVTLQFEGSGRWPDDLVAIQRTKIAFLLKLEEMLRESSDSLSTRVGLENEGEDALNQAFLEVTYNSEATFRLRIYHDREQTLLERQLKDPATDPRSKEVAATGLAKYKRDYVKAPAHTQAIARLCSRHPAMSGSIRLTKKWFSGHLLSNHIADEIIELLVARTFVQPWPWQAPSSPQIGFLRTLFWISRWDWRADPLIVDLSGSGDLTEPGIKAIRTRFEAWRKLDPGLNRIALFAASNVDADGTTWTDGQPVKVVAGRMTALAKAACAEVSQQQQQLEPTSLFSSPLSDFDFVLHLNPKLAAERSKPNANGPVFKNLEIGITDTENIGYDPMAELAHELESLYGSAVVFFHGASDCQTIAGLWSPVTAARSWKVNLAYSTLPDKAADEELVRALINKKAIVSEIAHLGGNLIERVELNR